MQNTTSAPIKESQKALLKRIEDAVNNPANIDSNLNADLRPLQGLDLERFRAKHNLQTVDVIYALCIQNGAKFNRLVRAPSLPYAVELLIRMYEKYPEHTPWRTIAPNEAFDILYGEILDQFKDTPYFKEARTALYRRFAATCGRSLFTAYRWVMSEGASKKGVSKVFSKICIMENPRQILEDLTRQMYSVRGFDFDQYFPIPTLDNPPLPRKPGPLVRGKSNAK